MLLEARAGTRVAPGFNVVLRHFGRISARSRSFPFRTHTERVLALALALAVALPAGAATAQEEASMAFSNLPMTRYRKAHAAMQRNDWQGARTVLLELWNKSKSYDVAASLAQVEHALGNDVSAARYLSFAVAHLAPKERPETLARYRAALDELEERVGQLQVSVNREAAEVRVDGTLIGLSPIPSTVFVEPGEHTVEARSKDGAATNRIEVARGASVMVELFLAKPAPEPLAAPTPSRATSPALVANPVLVAAPALSATTPPALAQEQATSRSAIPVFVGGGVTLVGVGMAIGFGLAANSDEAKARALQTRLGPNGCTSGDATRSACDAAERAIEVQQRDARLSNVGIGVASVGAVATLTYLLFWPKSKSKQASSAIRPNAAWTAAGASLELLGEF